MNVSGVIFFLSQAEETKKQKKNRLISGYLLKEQSCIPRLQIEGFKELSPEADEFPKSGWKVSDVRELIARSFLLACFLFCFVLFVCFLFSLSFFFFLLAAKFGLLVLQFKSEISKCFLHSNFQGVIITPKMESKFQVQDNPFYEVTLTPDLTPNLPSF